MRIFDKIDEIASMYTISANDVIEELRQATLKHIHLRVNEDIETYFEDGKIMFCVRGYGKKVLEIGTKPSFIEERRVIDITKNEKLYLSILKSFENKLKNKSDDLKFEHLKQVIDSDEPFCKGKILRSTKNGYVVLTSHGEAFLHIKNTVEKEVVSNVYKPGRELDFLIIYAERKKGKIWIHLSRTSDRLAKHIILKNFPKELVLHDVKRKCGAYLKIFHHPLTEPSEEFTRNLRFLFGGERIIYLPIAAA